MSKNKAQIEGIFPLSSLQQAYLMHYLHREDDFGLLQGHLILTGKLNFELLTQAWQQTAQRHSALRTSIHWEKIEKPVQVIRKQVLLPVTFYDWSAMTKQDFNKKIDQIKEEENYKIRITEVPVSKVVVIKQAEEKHILLWNCHHILLDGWSTAIVLQDVFKYYEALCKNQSIRLEAVPTYKMYFEQLKNQNKSLPQNFWSNYFSSDTQPTVFAPPNTSGQKLSFKNYTFYLSERSSSAIQKYCRQERITLGTFMKGLWAILLRRYFESDRVNFGATVSGRVSSLPNVDLMAGLFMNVLPIQTRVNPQEKFGEWLRNFQKEQLSAFKFENVPLNQILAWANTKHLNLFDSIIVVENIPWGNFQSGELMIEGVNKFPKTTYSLTIGILPSKKIKFLFRYNEAVIDQSTLNWLEEQIKVIIERISGYTDFTIQNIVEGLSNPPSATPTLNKTQQQKKYSDFIAPQNQLELKLTKIWEEVLGLSPIGARDHFFEIGGNSLLAVLLFAKIEQQLGYNLPPITLLQYPSPRDLAAFISSEETPETWSSLVALRATGNKLPLFCIHAGDAHVFFYKKLMEHLALDQPVYAFQPIGLDGLTSFHESIEEMAAHYISEMKRVQPRGPYALLGYCFSLAVCHEMGKQLLAEGQSKPLLLMVDGRPGKVLAISPPKKVPIRIRRMATMIQNGDWKKILKAVKIRKRLLIKKAAYAFKTNQEQTLEKLRDALKEAVVKYLWTSISAKVTLIRSSGSAAKSYRDDHIPLWEALAEEGVDVYIVPGTHRTFFEEPDVIGLAQQIQSCLDKFESENETKKAATSFD